MEGVQKTYRKIWAFLSALFIISFVKAAYVCVPDLGDYSVYFHKGISVKAVCTGGHCCGEINGDFVLRRLPSFGGQEIKENVSVKTWDFDVVSVSRSVLIDDNKTYVTYAAKGVANLKITEEIPKSVADFQDIKTNALFIETDPVIVMYLKAEKGKPAVVSYSIEGSKTPSWEPAFEFSSCELMLEDVKIAQEGGSIKGEFVVKDKDRAVFVPGLRVKIDGSVIVPQYADGKYSFAKEVEGEKHTVEIEGNADGCPKLYYSTEVHSEGANKYVIALIVIFALALILLFKYGKLGK